MTAFRRVRWLLRSADVQTRDPMIDRRAFCRRRAGNIVSGVVLISSMAALAGLIGYILAGGAGVVWTVVLVVFGFLVLGRLPAHLILLQVGAVPLRRWQAPRLCAVIEELSRRADLPAAPIPHYVPDAQMNAFAVGTKEQGGIALTEGMLRTFTLREVAGVVAHEISHLSHGDTRVMALAAMLAQATIYLALAAQVVLLITLPWLIGTGGPALPLLPIVVVVVAPTLGTLLLLALSRNREYAADLDAAVLTGDPEGLARALELLERYQGMWLESIFGTRRGFSRYRWLASHPPTAERVRRLRELERPPVEPLAVRDGAERGAIDGWVEIPVRRRRW